MTDPFSLEGKTVLITGSSSGIGLAVAQAAAREGAKVVVNGRNPDRVQAALASLEGEGHLGQVADLTVDDEVKALVEAVPPLNGLVLNAGVFPRLIPFNMTDVRQVSDVISANFLSPVNVMSQLVRKRKLVNGSSVVMNTATAAFLGPAASAAYAAAKAALTTLGRSAGHDLARRGIRVNSVAPGYVKTEMTAASIPQSQFDLVPLGVAGPDDIAGPFLFLLSDASRWFTRSTIVADGGISLRMTPWL